MRITLKLSTATRGGGRVAKTDRGPGVPIIKMTRHHGHIYSRGAQCITTYTSMRTFDGISTDYIKKNCGELINYAVRILVKDGPTSIHR